MPNETKTEEKLDEIAGLLKHLLAIELARSGVNKEAIGKHLRVAKSTVVQMLKEVSKDPSH